MSKDTGEYESRTKVRGRFGDDVLWRNLVDADKHLGWAKNAVLRRIVVRRKPDCWQVIVKAERGKECRVAFLEAQSLVAAYELLSLALYHDTLNWHPDKYPG